MTDSLDQIRIEIDAIDDQIAALLQQRAQCAERVGHVKKHDPNPIYYRPEREAQIIRRVTSRDDLVMPKESVERIFREIISSCLGMERPLSIAYLGPAGTFSEEAVRKHFGGAVDAVAHSDIESIFKSVESGQCQYAMVPVENSTGGTITDTLDQLMDTSLKICGERYLRIHQNLCGNIDDVSQITKVYSHESSLKQCRNWLAANLPGVSTVPVRSNAEAARLAAQEAGAAAVCGAVAAEQYGLAIKVEKIEDRSDNTTRFWVIGDQVTKPSGSDKTSLLAIAPHKTGALFSLLQPLAELGLNMTRIESRPTPKGMWEYAFFIDIEGHASEARIESAIERLKDVSAHLRVLGAYPSAISKDD
ncbi:MAG: prephenate dehydratase [Gammaproteobacteria bacterium]|nr:prephenate dehydratase [Gammaproteobacteria bacterium]